MDRLYFFLLGEKERKGYIITILSLSFFYSRPKIFSTKIDIYDNYLLKILLLIIIFFISPEALEKIELKSGKLEEVEGA